MAANAYENNVFRAITYASEMLLIAYAIIISFIKYKVPLFNVNILIVSIILFFNYILSSNNPVYSDLIKFFGYLACFKLGSSFAKNNNGVRVNNNLLLFLILIPVIFVAVLDKTEKRTLFFVNSNVFVYLGLAMSLFYYFVDRNENKRYLKSWIILIAYILVGTSLGVMVAILISLILLYFRKTYVPWILICGAVITLIILNADLPIFIRIRDVVAVWGSMDSSDWYNIEDVNLYDLGERVSRTGERDDTTSSIWRFAHWIKLLKEYVNNLWNIPFGLGAGYSVMKTGLRPHNDFLLILMEYGLVIFCYFIFFLKKIWIVIGDKKILCFIIAMYCYHLTENLIDAFPPNSLLYFVLGFFLCKKRRSSANKLNYEDCISKQILLSKGRRLYLYD